MYDMYKRENPNTVYPGRLRVLEFSKAYTGSHRGSLNFFYVLYPCSNTSQRKYKFLILPNKLDFIFF